jgi:hypothetical protein
VGRRLVPLVLAWAWRPLGLELPPRTRLEQAGLLALGVLACSCRGPHATRSSARRVADDDVVRHRAARGANRETWSDPARRGARLDVLPSRPTRRAPPLAEPERDRRAGTEALAFLARRRPANGAARCSRACARVRAGARARRSLARTPRPPWRGGLALALAEGAFMAARAVGHGPARSRPAALVPGAAGARAHAVARDALLVSGSMRPRLEIEPLAALLAAVGLHHARRKSSGSAAAG